MQLFILPGGLHPHRGEAKKTITTQMVESYQGILKPGEFCIDIGAPHRRLNASLSFSRGQIRLCSGT